MHLKFPALKKRIWLILGDNNTIEKKLGNILYMYIYACGHAAICTIRDKRGGRYSEFEVKLFQYPRFLSSYSSYRIITNVHSFVVLHK